MKRVNSESNTKQCLSIAESCASSTTVKTKININKSVTIRFNWNGKSHQRTLLAKNFADQCDRFYAYFYIGKDYFHFEDDMERGQAQLRMPGVWFVPEDEDTDEEYYWNPERLQVVRVDGKPVSLINNGRA